MILAREVDGTLRTANLDEQRRMRQIYFPVVGREIIMPKMFEEENLEVRRTKFEKKFHWFSFHLENLRKIWIRIHIGPSLCSVRTGRDRLHSRSLSKDFPTDRSCWAFLLSGHTSNLRTYRSNRFLRHSSVDSSFWPDGFLFCLVQKDRSTSQRYDSTRFVRSFF